jgi:hypothetical protein
MNHEMKEYDPDIFADWFFSEMQAGRMPEERLTNPNWGVSAEFLINAALDNIAARQARWMKPLLFLTGISVGMLSAAVMILMG